MSSKSSVLPLAFFEKKKKKAIWVTVLPLAFFSKKKKMPYELVRASIVNVAKIMSFYHTKGLLYYFTTSFYNISFIRCFIIQFYTLK